MRPAFHFTPPANWLNDPNGLVFLDGEYHLFYQHHPHSTDWGPMHWGHAISRDLLHWEHLPIAIFPDEAGMIFSGSAVVDWQNTAGFGAKALIAIYTCHHEPGHHETQSLAYSFNQGRTWAKYSGNPVIPNHGLRDFRDPKVFWHVDHWVMCLSTGSSILFYASPNLKDWARMGSFGAGYGSHDGVWETPDLFQLPVTGSRHTRWVLTVGVGDGGPAGGSATQYFIGHFDGATFISENPPETVLWMDYGPDFYAPQSWNDEPRQRRILTAWMSNWQYARTTPLDGWRGAFTLPREAGLLQTPNGIRLMQKPLEALETLRKSLFYAENLLLRPGENPLSGISGDCLEIATEIVLPAPVFGFRLRVGADEETVITCSAAAQTIRLDRSRSGQVNFHQAFAAIHTAPLPLGETLTLSIFIDRSSIEIFAQNGRLVITESIFPSETSLGLEIFTEGDATQVKSLKIYKIS